MPNKDELRGIFMPLTTPSSLVWNRKVCPFFTSCVPLTTALIVPLSICLPFSNKYFFDCRTVEALLFTDASVASTEVVRCAICCSLFSKYSLVEEYPMTLFSGSSTCHIDEFPYR